MLSPRHSLLPVFSSAHAITNFLLHHTATSIFTRAQRFHIRAEGTGSGLQFPHAVIAAITQYMLLLAVSAALYGHVCCQGAVNVHLLKQGFRGEEGSSHVTFVVNFPIDFKFPSPCLPATSLHQTLSSAPHNYHPVQTHR